MLRSAVCADAASLTSDINAANKINDNPRMLFSPRLAGSAAMGAVDDRSRICVMATSLHTANAK
jgi:hypothetical protein